MTTDDKVRDQNPKYDFNREAAKISVLSLGKIDKCEYFADEDILPMHQGRMMKQANFSYSLLGKSFEIQIKTIEDKKKTKQIKAIKSKENSLILAVTKIL